MHPTRVVIAGGGFGGVRAALELDKQLGPNAEITLIDRNGYHLFAPALYEVGSAYGMKDDRFSVNLRKTVSIPFADIFQATRIKSVEANIGHISLDEKFVSTNGDIQYPFDYLVLALGAQTNHYNIPGVREYAFPFKTIEDALMLNHQLLRIYERALKGNIELPLRIIIGGGGFTGVELAAELAGATRFLGANLQSGHTQIILMEAGPRILPMISDKERSKIINRLTKLGIVIKEHCAIEYVAEDVVKLSNGSSHRSDIVIWTAGIQANQFLKTIQGLELTHQGKVVVDEHLNTSRYPYVFAIGDIVEFIDPRTQCPEPAFAYVAVQHGSTVAHNIVQDLRGKKLKKHVPPRYNTWIIPMGGKHATAHLSYGLRFTGYVGWLIRGIADLKYFISILSFRRALRLFREEMDVFLKND